MDMKIIGDLAIEVTQKCNLSCEHCLRGCARNVNITHEIIDKTLDNFDYISSILFTGGEPTLNVDAITYTIDEIIRRNIRVGHFYVVTNGVKYSPELVLKLLDLYAYCDDYDCMSGLCVSVDGFHDNYNDETYRKYSGLAFFRKDKEHSGFWDGEIINRGNAEEYGVGTFYKKIEEFNPNYAYLSGDTIEYSEILYVNSKGYVFFDCDLSYELQDENQTINVLTDNIGDWMYSEVKEFNNALV